MPEDEIFHLKKKKKTYWFWSNLTARRIPFLLRKIYFMLMDRSSRQNISYFARSDLGRIDIGWVRSNKTRPQRARSYCIARFEFLFLCFGLLLMNDSNYLLKMVFPCFPRFRLRLSLHLMKFDTYVDFNDDLELDIYVYNMLIRKASCWDFMFIVL